MSSVCNQNRLKIVSLKNKIKGRFSEETETTAFPLIQPYHGRIT